MINIANITDAVSNTIGFAEKQLGGAARGVADLVTSIPELAIYQPKPGIYDAIRPGLLDLIKLPNLPAFPKPAAPSGDSSFQGMLDSIGGLSGEIDDLKKQLENPDLTPEQRMELSFKMQEKMQERMQMITMLTNLLKSEHDSTMAVVNNLRV